jgi:hypothetical protein
MYAAAWRSAMSVAVLGALASAAAAETPMHQRKPVRLLSTVNAVYQVTRDGRDIGRERFERRTYDDNTVVYDVHGTTSEAPGIDLVQQSTLVLDEESYFPRTLRADKTIIQPTDTLRIAFTVDMFSNVAVLASNLSGRVDSRRVVVPTGVPVIEVGTLYGWYEILFWLDLSTRERQRIQWLDAHLGKLESGEIYLTGEETIDVLGKKTTVSVLKAERDRLGPAKVYVDAARRIVRCEQNMSQIDLVEWTEK